jgi:hypothetical protein
MKVSAALLLLGLGVGSLGCATVPMASADDDARMKLMAPPPDQALVYLYRNEIIGYAIGMDVSMDGVLSGRTVAKSYMVWQLPPGTHRVVSHSETDSEIEFDFQPGQRYFIWQEVKMGIVVARSRLHLVSEPEGRTGVGECKLIRMPLPPPRPISTPPGPAS